MDRPAAAAPTTVVFDVGGVLLDWNPRYLFRKLIADDAAMEDFLARVCSPAWNHRQDEGRSFAAAVAERTALFPEFAAWIAAYNERWEEMIKGPFDATVDLVYRLKARGMPLLALTNFSVEKFSLMRQRFAFFNCFDAIVVSGEVGIAKPDPRVFTHLIAVAGPPAAELLLIDDTPVNVSAAQAAGLQALHFISAAVFEQDLKRYGLLD